jgi:catechol 2,3-dioxygenase-like lactoylglutathione lyase family enzyme
LTNADVRCNLDNTSISINVQEEPVMSRVQLALNVDDLEKSIDFYRRLFGAEPAKVRPGYANFAVVEPPLKLVLIENPGKGGSVNHLGVEVDDVDTVDAIQARLAGDGLASVDERGTTCCYAEQDKFWVQGTPDGESWEVSTVLADSAVAGGPAAGSDCSCGSAAVDPPSARAAAPGSAACCG